MRYLLLLLCLHFVYYDFAQGCGSISDCNQKGDSFFEGKDYEQAYVCYLNNARRNDSYAQLQLGRMILDGNIDYGLEKQEAIDVLTKSASNGNINAMELIGDCYYKGIIVSQNYKEAESWYMKAADKGSGYAAYVIGTFYDYEGKLKKDLSSAKKYYYLAADRGNLLAVERLRVLNAPNNFSSTKPANKELPGGQFDVNINNLKKEWYYNQSVSYENPIIRDDEKIVEETYFLNKDYNYDGIPDFGKVTAFKLNAENSFDPSVLLLFTTKFDKYKGGEVQFYIEDPATFLVVKDSSSRNLTDVSNLNVFYRFSKVTIGGASVRNMTSLPILLQAPQNYKEKKETVIYIKYITRVASYTGCVQDESKSDYFMATVDGLSDLDPITNDKKFWIDIVCNHTSVPYLIKKSDGNILSTNKVSWGKEKVFSIVWFKIKLTW